MSASALAASSLQAQVLASYDMQDTGNLTTASFTDADVTASTLGGTNLNGAGAFSLAGVDASDTYTGWSRPNPNPASGNTVTDALNDGNFFTLSLTPNAGNALSLTSLTFDAFAATGGPSERSVYIFSDQAAFTAGNELFTASTVTGLPLIPYNGATADVNFSVDLSTIGALAIDEAISFRFYLQTPVAGQNLAFDDITVNGSVIPEPASAALLMGGLGVAMLGLKRRRKA